LGLYAKLSYGETPFVGKLAHSRIFGFEGESGEQRYRKNFSEKTLKKAGTWKNDV